MAGKISTFMSENDRTPSTSISSAITATESGRRNARRTIHINERCYRKRRLLERLRPEVSESTKEYGSGENVASFRLVTDSSALRRSLKHPIMVPPLMEPVSRRARLPDNFLAVFRPSAGDSVAPRGRKCNKGWFRRGRSSARLERRPVTSEVVGSNPIGPAKTQTAIRIDGGHGR